MKNWLLIIIILLGLSASSFVDAQFPEFRYYEIGQTDDDLLGQSSLADIDKDGDLDFIVGSSAGTIWWFEYTGSDQWIKHVLGENVFTDKGGVAFDVDGDGWVDQVSGGTWYKNTSKPKEEKFIRYENGAIYAYDNIAGDINGDGKPELFSLSAQEGLFMYQIPVDPTKKWKKIKIGDGINGGIYPLSIADMDNDKDMDIVRSNVWYENELGDGSKWSIHRTISFVQSTGSYAYSSRIYVVDFDKDGDNDIIQAECNIADGKIAWHANKDGKAINWFTHKIDYDTKQDLHGLCVADFDNDGDLDIFSGGGPMTGDLSKRCFIWENNDGPNDQWIRHEILTEIECIDAVAADVDGDGDIDICGKPWKGDKPYFLKNMLIESK
jgi:hypothetical protein